MDSCAVLFSTGMASLFRRTVAFLFIYLLFASAPSEGRRVREAAVARCSFRTGDTARDARLTPFYVPVEDQQMYEEGIKDYLSQMGASSDQFSVVCVEAKDKDVKCELCLYNEVSEDRKHVRQGQVLDTMLLECIEGKFTQGSIMANSQYHPICYPPPHKSTREAKEGEEKSVSPHQHFGEVGASNTGPESCATGGKGSGGF